MHINFVKKTNESADHLDEVQVYDALIDAGLFTQEELDLVTDGWGFSMRTLNTVCQVRFGMDADQVLEEEV